MWVGGGLQIDRGGSRPVLVRHPTIPDPHSVTGFQLAPTGSTSLVKSMGLIQNPVEVCDQVFDLIERLTSQIQKRLEDPKSAGELWSGCGWSPEYLVPQG